MLSSDDNPLPQNKINVMMSEKTDNRAAEKATRKTLRYDSLNELSNDEVGLMKKMICKIIFGKHHVPSRKTE